MRWYSNIGRRVWLYEIWQWLFYDRRVIHGPKVAEQLLALERSQPSALSALFKRALKSELVATSNSLHEPTAPMVREVLECGAAAPLWNVRRAEMPSCAPLAGGHRKESGAAAPHSKTLARSTKFMGALRAPPSGRSHFEPIG